MNYLVYFSYQSDRIINDKFSHPYICNFYTEKLIGDKFIGFAILEKCQDIQHAIDKTKLHFSDWAPSIIDAIPVSTHGHEVYSLVVHILEKMKKDLNIADTIYTPVSKHIFIDQIIVRTALNKDGQTVYTITTEDGDPIIASKSISFT